MTAIAHYRSAAPARYGRAGDNDSTGEEAPAIAQHVRDFGSSFSWGMRLVPAPRRNAMYALYAFCCEVDDIAGGDATASLKLTLLSKWRCEIARLFTGRPQHRVTLAIATPVRDYNLRCEDFLSVIDGMEMDARRDIRAPSLAELDLYCARVAAAGRIAVRIMGVGTPDADRVVAELGRALQLTNILRGLAEDASRHRLYLPRELLHAHGIFATMPSYVLAQPALPQVCCDVAKLAKAHYAAAAAAIAVCPRREMRPVALMLVLYRALLDRLLARGWNRLDDTVRIPRWQIAALVLRAGLAGR